MPCAPLRRCTFAAGGRRCVERQDGPYCSRHVNLSARNHRGIPRQARGLGADHDRVRKTVIGGPCELRLPGCTGIATSLEHRRPRSQGGTLEDGYGGACAHCQDVQGAKIAAASR